MSTAVTGTAPAARRPRHRARTTALAIGAAVVALAGVVLAVTTAGWGSVYLDEPVAGIVLAAVGGVLATRLPRNPIGWLFLAGGWGGAIATLANAYVTGADAGTHGVWYLVASGAGSSLWAAPFALIPLLLLLFPSGRLRSRRWWPAAALGVLGAVLMIAVLATGGVVFSDPAAPAPPPWLLAIGITGGGMVIVALLAGLVHLTLRARTAHGDERQQVRWLLAGGVATGVLVGVGMATLDEDPTVALTFNEVAFAAALLPLPIATGVAVLRHRLYDLGRLLSRTLVYGVLTAALLGVYLGLVTFVALLAPAGRGSPLAVSCATLAAAALFRPLRAGLQSAVDRRFNRQRYDAPRAAEAFRAHVRDQVDLQAVAAELVVAAQRTVQPATAAVWLREPRR